MGYKPKHIHRKQKAPRKKGRKILISVIAAVLVAAIGAGIWFGVRGSAKPVSVFAFDNVGMTEFWGDSQESYGPVTTDRIQTVFLSETQTVTDILVAEGDEVKKGDPLMTFDTTLSELELERKRLEVEKLKIDLTDAENYLMDIRNMTPLKMPDYIPAAPQPSLGRPLTKDYELCKDERIVGLDEKHDGTSPEKAVICWVDRDYYEYSHIDHWILQYIWTNIDDLRSELGSQDPTEPPTESTESTESTDPVTDPATDPTPAPTTTEATTPEATTTPATEAAPEPPATDTPATDTPVTDTPVTDTEANQTSVIASQSSDWRGNPISLSASDMGSFASLRMTGNLALSRNIPSSASAIPGDGNPTEDSGSGDESGDGSDEESSEPDGPNPEDKMHVYVVFKVTQDNMILGTRTVWQGMDLCYEDSGGNVSFTFFDAYGMEDYSLPDEEEIETPSFDFDFGGPYTASELQKMRKEQEKKVKEVDLQLKMAEADYKLMQREVNDGKIYADFDGQVVSLITEDEARDQKLPLMKVSGGGGFYIQCSVSELSKDAMVIGQEVTVQDWSAGGTYTGTVQSIQDLPSGQDGWRGMGNPNASYYPFTVFVTGDADLQEGRYVSVTFSAGEEEHGVYLNNPFVRTEGGESYVYVRGAHDRLEKRAVTVGKSLWGSYTEILSGLTAEDYIAFPYGKDVKDGAPTQEGDISELYY